MIAEINNKISQNGSNLSNRQEDKLTGDVFGALRYLPYANVLKKILVERSILCENIYVELEMREDFFAEKIHFWPYDKEGELDLIVETDDTVLGIEVKYYSGKSSTDDVIDYRISNDQLVRESRIVKRMADKKGKLAALLFVAKEPECSRIAIDTMSSKQITPEVEFSYLSWESICNCIDNIELQNSYQKLILDDIKKLLHKKGFDRFKNFKNLSNYLVGDVHFEFNKVVNRSYTFGFDNMNLLVEKEVCFEFK